MTTLEWQNYGKAVKGKTIHFAIEATGEGEERIGLARCDKNLIVKIVPKANMRSVTCKKCQQYSDYKSRMYGPFVGDEAAKAKPKPKPATKPKPVVREVVPEERIDLVPKKENVLKKRQPVQKSIKEIEKKPEEKEAVTKI